MRENLMEIVELVKGLFDKNNKQAYACLQELEAASGHSREVYRHVDVFAEMLDSDNSYIRTRGMVLIYANAQWDEDYKIDEVIDKFLRHITDVKPIMARQCIKRLGHKPYLKSDITEALNKAYISFYADSMRPLVGKDIRDATAKINSEK